MAALQSLCVQAAAQKERGEAQAAADKPTAHEVIDSPTQQELAHNLMAAGRQMPGTRVEDTVAQVPHALFADLARVFQPAVAQEGLQLYQRNMLETQGNVLASTSAVTSLCLKHADELADRDLLQASVHAKDPNKPSPRLGLAQQKADPASASGTSTSRAGVG